MPNYLPSQSSTLQPSITKRCRTKQQKDEFPRIPAKFAFLTPEVSLFEKNSSFETISDFSFKEDLLTNKEFSGLVPNNFWCHQLFAELFSYFKDFKCDRTEQILASFFSLRYIGLLFCKFTTTELNQPERSAKQNLQFFIILQSVLAYSSYQIVFYSFLRYKFFKASNVSLKMAFTTWA